MGLDRSLFKFSTSLRVRNYEVDWQGIVHNATYLLYCEAGRIEYLEAMGVQISLEAIRKESLIVVARNEIDYLSPARYGERLRILTRIPEIRTSSFVFEGIIESEGDGRRIVENKSYHVWLDEKSGRPARVGTWFREAVKNYEGEKTSA